MNSCGTIRVLHLLHRRKTSRYHARLDLPLRLPSHMHEDHDPRKGHTGEIFRCLVLNLATQVAKIRTNQSAAHNYTCIFIRQMNGKWGEQQRG